MLPITKLTKEDFDQIIEQIEVFWGVTNDKLLYVHHPMFLYEFGDTAYVVKDGDKVVGYLFGFISQTDPQTAYGHVIACHPDYRGRGVVETLMWRFGKETQERGCTRAKAIIFPKNFRSLLFHMKMGFEPEGVGDGNGVRVVKDYWGKGIDYSVLYLDFTKIPPELALAAGGEA
ncbi:MAG TPA: GNAT family N-acetyltransferase [Thermoanaerobaculia bacterium]